MLNEAFFLTPRIPVFNFSAVGTTLNGANGILYYRTMRGPIHIHSNTRQCASTKAFILTRLQLNSCDRIRAKCCYFSRRSDRIYGSGSNFRVLHRQPITPLVDHVLITSASKNACDMLKTVRQNDGGVYETEAFVIDPRRQTGTVTDHSCRH